MNKFIIFDLGQVIVQVDLKTFLINFSREFKTDPDRLVKGQYDGVHQDFMVGKINGDEFHKQTCELFKYSIPLERFKNIWDTMLRGEIEGTSEIVYQLHQQGYSLAVLSNTDPWHFEWCRRNIPVLQKFERFFLSYDLKMKKPDPGIFLHVAKELNVKTSQCLFIDDSTENITQAKSLNFRTIHFEDAEQLKQELDIADINI